MVFLYTLIVIIITSAIWYLKEGVTGEDRHSPSDFGRAQRSPPRTPDRKARLKALKKKEEDESEEEVSRPNYLPTPTQSPVPPTPHTTPSSVPLTPKECQLPLTPVMVWGMPYHLPGQSSQSVGQASASSQTQVQSEAKKKESEEGPQQEDERRKKEEEDRRTASSSGAPSAAHQPATQAGGNRNKAPRPQGQREEENEEEIVLTTRYGKVHHRTRECDYLKARTTGQARRSPWCAHCKASRGMPTQATLWSATWGGSVHSNRSCPNLGLTDLLRYTPCTRCRGPAG